MPTVSRTLRFSRNSRDGMREALMSSGAQEPAQAIRAIERAAHSYRQEVTENGNHPMLQVLKSRLIGQESDMLFAGFMLMPAVVQALDPAMKAMWRGDSLADVALSRLGEAVATAWKSATDQKMSLLPLRADELRSWMTAPPHPLWAVLISVGDAVYCHSSVAPALRRGANLNDEMFTSETPLLGRRERN